MKKRNRTVMFIITVIVVIMLLFILKSCVNENETIDNNIYENLDKGDKQIIEDTRKPISINSFEEYGKVVKPLDKLSDTVVNNIVNEIIKEGNSIPNKDSNSGAEVFQCDEDTAKIYDGYSRMFKILGDSYGNISYMNKETHGEVEYLSLKSSYYTDMSEVLENISKSIRDNKVEEVLDGFDTMGSILENINNLGGYDDESL